MAWLSFRQAVFAIALFLTATLRAAVPPAEELRALWVDAWGAGFQTPEQINNLTNDLRTANFNTVIPQVRRRGDAFYRSALEPQASACAPNFDPLADILAKCHDTNFGPRLEVHAWLVTYHIWQGTNPPAAANHPFHRHPDWLLEDVNGKQFLSNEYTFDPGHPEVQRHTFNVAMDLIKNYDLDGISFDYIRYSKPNEGYNPVSVARFNQRYQRTGRPAPADELWKQFRRDQITGLLRKIYLHALATRPQLKVSCATITWSPGPTNLASWYSSSAAWNGVLQDWRGWMEEGIVDWNLPMTYFDQCSPHTNAWFNWNHFIKDHQYRRHAAIGPGTYLNTAANAIAQMRYARTASPAGNYAHGIVNYSYRVPTKDDVTRASFFAALAQPSALDPAPAAIFAAPAAVPAMPWKTKPTLGHLMGNLAGQTDANALDGATVTISGPAARTQVNDATGFYGFVDLPPGNYTLTAAYTGYTPATTNFTIAAGMVATCNLTLVPTNANAAGLNSIMPLAPGIPPTALKNALPEP